MSDPASEQHTSGGNASDSGRFEGARRPRRWLRYGSIGALILIVVSFALATWVYGDFKSAPLEPMEPAPGVGGLSAQQCRICHEQIYDEWAASGHARAFTDPLYQAELPHQPAPFVCHRCHTPLREQRPQEVYGLWLAWPAIVPISWANSDFDANLQQEGVTCVACHQVEGEMVGPISDPQAPPHPTRVVDLRAVDTCATCHQFGFERIGKLDRPIIDTVTEWGEFSAKGGTERCADCHMPIEGEAPAVRDGPLRPHTNHRLRGPFDAEFVATGVLVQDASIERSGDGVRGSLTIENGTGHRLPSAEPQRYIRVVFAALDADGTAIAQQELRIERPVDVVRLRELGVDNTLAPKERRPLSLALDDLPDAATEVRLSVDFHVWHDDEVAAAAGLSGDDLRHPIFSQTWAVPK